MYIHHLIIKSLSPVWLFETPWTVTHQAPLSVQFFLAGTLEWVAISFSNICVCSRTSTEGRSSSNSTVVPSLPLSLCSGGLRRNALLVEPQGAGASWLLPTSGIPSSFSSAWLWWRDCVSLKLQEEVASLSQKLRWENDMSVFDVNL